MMMQKGTQSDWQIRLLLGAILWLMVLVVWVKGSLGWEVRSLSLIVQAFHTLIICFNTLFSLLSIVNADHPDGRMIYGHGQRETLATFVLIALLTLMTVLFASMFVPQLLAIAQRQPLPFDLQIGIPLVQLLGMISAIPLGLACFCGYQARQLNHPILAFNTKQLFIETGLSFFVMAGLWGVWFGEPLIDLIVALILWLVALDRVWQVIAWQFPLLVEQTAIAPDVLAAIARNVDGVKRCDRIRSRGIVGQFVYLQMHLIIDHHYEPLTHELVRELEAELRRRYGALQVTFYVESDRE
ncbi:MULTISPECIES: cation diffusion facilitator family transporter [Spirulina]|jgi:cation diffusion facilitator family transporter|uniref:cation diffusion facilitator family transporter n=2 Tax=Spirulinaceae TaxID=1890448 RepID=UPI00232A8D9D|nr:MULTISPECIES: cation transporter [Spirulina]